jgi:hypothetical protein
MNTACTQKSVSGVRTSCTLIWRKATLAHQKRVSLPSPRHPFLAQASFRLHQVYAPLVFAWNLAPIRCEKKSTLKYKRH